jgi:hypothetical protein
VYWLLLQQGTVLRYSNLQPTAKSSQLLGKKAQCHPELELAPPQTVRPGQKSLSGHICNNLTKPKQALIVLVKRHVNLKRVHRGHQLTRQVKDGSVWLPDRCFGYVVNHTLADDFECVLILFWRFLVARR